MIALKRYQDSDRRTPAETVSQQVTAAAQKTIPAGGNPGSHVTTYGSKALLQEKVSVFQGVGGATEIAKNSMQQVDLAASRITPQTPWLVKKRKQQALMNASSTPKW